MSKDYDCRPRGRRAVEAALSPFGRAWHWLWASSDRSAVWLGAALILAARGALLALMVWLAVRLAYVMGWIR